MSLSYLSQLGGLMWLQFVSAATGIAALAALARALAGRPLGNFFMDLQRASFLVLLPLALVLAILLVLGGVPMTFDGSAVATTLEGVQQAIARGPVAAFVAIKQLGTNGGGFFGPNSTHPLENPSFWTNMIQMVAIVLVLMACVWMFGRIIGRMRHAGVIFAVMMAFILVKIAGAVYFESALTQAFAHLPIDQTVGNPEGKEMRFGPAGGPLWSVLTTSTSNGSVGAIHDSLNPMTGSIRIAVATLLICVAGYTTAVWAVAHAVSPETANGSLITGPDGAIVGSRQVAQAFTSPGYFWPRPSSVVYNGAGGSNKSPTSPGLTVRDLAQSLEGDAVTIPGGDHRVADDVVAYAQANNISHIVVGKSSRSRWFEIMNGSVVHELVRRAGNISVHVVAGEAYTDTRIARRSIETARHRPMFEWRPYLKSTLIVAVATAIGMLPWPGSTTPPNTRPPRPRSAFAPGMTGAG